MLSFSTANMAGYSLDFSGILLMMVMFVKQRFLRTGRTPKCSTDIVKDLFKTERVIVHTELVGACRNAALHATFLPSECEWFFIVSLFYTLPYI